MRLPILLLVSSPLWAQAEQTFPFTHAESVQDMQEIATAVRTVGDLASTTLDQTRKTLTVQGPAAQIALADFLFHGLDVAPSADAAPLEYRLAGNAENVVSIFYLSSSLSAQDFQEIVTLLRSITMTRRVFTYYRPRAVAMRGTAEQTALAGWLRQRLEQPANQPAPLEYQLEYQMTGGEQVRVLHLASAATAQDFQEAATMIRAVGEIRFVFTYNRPRALAIRGSVEQLALAAWMVKQLGHSVPGQTASYRLPESQEGDVRIFYLPADLAPRDFQDKARQIRRESGTRWAFTYQAPRILAVRGTPDQAAAAERLVAALH